ncbi:probable ubiquitin carboxyl-terminal hydrolase FAF-X isoform X3 [Strongylocentrotus purpuratus]|uniref:ubiquitinyl hydrolase 1 n=1 Tax=Strongylocentrotus purpuratus TaxID=7668 RepID=A0A7M7NR02_STRPU|nr:probable ubiquitin carboxyl-terminal hydrolase FAF-X isoform X3 [Strongylocentrotus purpuratus]
MTLGMKGTPTGAGDTAPEATPVVPPQPSPPQQAGSQQPPEPTEGGSDGGDENTDMEEPPFPAESLNRLDEMINKPRWVIPVLPKGELEVLLEAAIELSKKNLDIRSESCQRFFRDGLTISFTKILTDEAVSGWKFEIHRCIMKNTEKLIELCVSKLSQDWFPLLELLAMALNPLCKFHVFNGSRQSETVPMGSQLNNNDIFARPPDIRNPKGWLVDLLNRFGALGGFDILQERFLDESQSLNVPIIHALLRPWGQCYELITQHTVQTHFMPIVDRVVAYLDGLSDDELKKESKNEARNDALSSIIKALRNLVSKVPNQEEKIKNLEMFRLKMILRLLQISSFNGKMNALNEVNKVIANVTYYTHKQTGVDEEEYLTAERMAEWIQENKVLSIVLRDSLHQPQYVEKLEKILRFVIKEKALTMEDLDNIWAAQVGKHEAIVKNVHDLLAKLAWDFSPEQLDHLFDCFQESWATASTKQREKLLELIRRLAEDDKDGLMAHKVLSLLWTLAHQQDVPTDIMDQALHAHTKILDYSCSQDRDSQKLHWIDKFVEELRKDNWVIPALKQIKEICSLFAEAPQNYPTAQRSSHVQYRHDVINSLQTKHSLVTLVAENLSSYMNHARQSAKENPDPQNIPPDSRYSHVQQVQERLNFLRFLLKDGQLWLCAPQAKEIWHCLAENSVYVSDREACFKWFSKMGEEPDLDPEINRDFFEDNILQLDPALLTENGIKCFDRFFKAVNSKEGKLVPKRRAFLMDDLELIGLDYLWRVVLCSGDEIALKAIELLKETYTNLGPKLQASQSDIHEDFIQSCMDRLKAMYDTLRILETDKECADKVQHEATRMTRILTILKEYISEYDLDFTEERTILPMARAHRGKHVTLNVRFPNQGRQVDDIDIWSHTNESLASVRRQILLRAKANLATTRLDLYINGELLDPAEDRRLVGDIPLRDRTLITAKLCQMGSNMPSSPDSSSDSSGGSPHHPYDGPNVEAEKCLPGVLMSLQHTYVEFLFHLSDLGCNLNISPLRNGARALLKIMPADVTIVDKLIEICRNNAKLGDQSASPSLESLFFGSSSSQVLYHLEVVYSLLMPARQPHSEPAFDFQYNFLKSGGVSGVMNMLTKNNFLPNADMETRRSALLMVLKVGKLMFTTLAYARITAVAEACQTDPAGGPSQSSVSQTTHTQAVVLQQAMQHIPNPNAECVLRNVAVRLGRQAAEESKSDTLDLSVVKAIKKIAWSAGCGCSHLLHGSNEEVHKSFEKADSGEADGDDAALCREALEVLTVCLALCPQALDALNKDKAWQCCIIDLLLLAKTRSVRVSAMEQFQLIATKCSSGNRPLIFFITLCFSVLQNKTKEHPGSCSEYFLLLCRLLNYGYVSNSSMPNAEALLNNEIDWLKKVRDGVLTTGECLCEETLLEGHQGITRELLAFMTSEKKFQVGSKKDGCQLIKELLDDFLFPASKIVVQTLKNGAETPLDPVIPVCTTPPTINAAFDLLVALCMNCVPNLKLVTDTLTDMYYSAGNDAPLTEWEYLPPVGPRPNKGFVGLKNAGATCYMNSVLQQIYMVPEIRRAVLSAEGAIIDTEDDFYNDEKQDNESNIDIVESEVGSSVIEEGPPMSKQEETKEYNLGVLKHVQAIFGHLAESKLQYYVPRGFWKHFKLGGEPVNLREQHDALEFFNSLVDSLDEALKAHGANAVFAKVLGGSYADQMICKDCPHRYSRESMFTTLNVDIRNNQNLLDSLEQFVKGDLLEGDNAYRCEKCNKKVDTVKRMCIKRLPKVLAIQLKRFDYDWERECAIKFNDYFEFPKEFDMDPYTVEGLAKIEGEIIADDERENSEEEEEGSSRSTKYRLVGVVVHSGQASGGHYYSYILHRNGGDGNQQGKWYKFDDGEVTECRMEDDEEMKNQCFGGEFMGEVFDHMLKRMSYRRQKRWWNAYILLYERMDNNKKELDKEFEGITIAPKMLYKMPPAIQRSVRKQNIQFMHSRMQYSPEYFQFVRKLVTCNAGLFSPPQGQELQLTTESEELAMLSIQLASRFLFTVGLHTKKTLRGPANDWYDALYILLRVSKMVRRWFAQNMLFSEPARFSEYLLDCPSSEVRNAFAKVIVILAHFSQQDGAFQSSLQGSTSPDSSTTLSNHLLRAVLDLLKKEVSEHGRHLTQYFQLFQMYANLGVVERTQLLKLNVPATFMLVALDEGPGPPIKYQYAELSKLYSVVSLLIRCCDVTSRTKSSMAGVNPLPNPHGDHMCSKPIMPIQAQVADLLFSRGAYIKKLIEDCNNSEETPKLLKFCSWENPNFTLVVLGELLWQVAYSYTYELRPYMDLLLQILLLQDSWQNHRILNALKGIPDDRDGLFDTIQRSKTHYQKRAYQCIKCMVALFSNCEAAHRLLQSHGDLKRKWNWAVEWLGDELDRRPYSGNTQYTYNSWSPPAQSNEISNGYFLERSHSARITLEKACQLCPEEEPDEPEMMDEHEGSDPQDEAPVPSTYPQSLPHLQTAPPNNQQQQQSSPPPSSSSSTSSSQQQSQQQPPVTAQNSQMQPQVPNNQQPAHDTPPTSGQVGSLHKHPNTINNTLHSPEQGGTTSPTTTTTTTTPAPNPPTSPPEEQLDEKIEGGNNKET